MIAYLKGEIVQVEKDIVIVSANGVGYEINCTQNTANSFLGENNCELYIKTVVREDDIILFGFKTQDDKKWFQIVTDVQGVGPRMGLTILNAYSPQNLLEIIMSEDEKALKAISGIGPKVASRVINELKSRKDITNSIAITPPKNTKGDAPAPDNNDAISALINLGFQRKDVFFAVKKITNDNDNLELEDVIKLALAELNS